MIDDNITIKEIKDKTDFEKYNLLMIQYRLMDKFIDVLDEAYEKGLVYEFLLYAIEWFNNNDEIQKGN